MILPFMVLKNKIQEDLKVAMRAKDQAGLAVLRMLQSAIRNKEISLRKGEDIGLSDEQITEVIASEIKKRKDSIEAFRRGGREDLAGRERAEIGILEKYLPEQIGDDELDRIISEAIGEMGDAERIFGAVMGKAMPRVKGKADGNRVAETVKRLLRR